MSSSRHRNARRILLFVGAGIWVLTIVLRLAFDLMGPARMISGWIGFVGLVILIVGAVQFFRSGKQPIPAVASPSQPIAHTPEGEPIYQVVGYTSDGKPITADKAVGFRPHNPRTNTYAIVALVMAFVLAPLGIIFGHMARGQIKQTGEQGDGLALAGLILGYLFTVGGLLWFFGFLIASS